MKKIIFSLLLGLSSIVFAAEDNYLFSQNSAQAEISHQKGNVYFLTIYDSSNFISYFSDRPNRKSGAITTPEFLKLWSSKDIKDNFAVNPPNVAVVMVNDKGHHQSAIGEITNPVYRKGVLSYQLNVLNHKSLKPGKLQHLAVVFDDIHWCPGAFGPCSN